MSSKARLCASVALLLALASALSGASGCLSSSSGSDAGLASEAGAAADAGMSGEASAPTDAVAQRSVMLVEPALPSGVLASNWTEAFASAAVSPPTPSTRPTAPSPRMLGMAPWVTGPAASELAAPSLRMFT